MMRVAECIVACVTTQEAREALKRATRNGCTVRFQPHEEKLTRSAMQDDVTMVVWEAGANAEAEMEEMARVTAHRAESVSVLVRVDLSRAAARQVIALFRHLPCAHLSLQGHDDLNHDIGMLRRETAERNADAAIVWRLLPLVPQGATDILATASIVGRRRTSVGAFARLCGVSRRTLQSRLRAAELIDPERLLGWMISLHALWRSDVLGWGPKRAATSTGFESPDVWSRYIARHVGGRPSKLLRDGGFPRLLNRCANEIFRCQIARES